VVFINKLAGTVIVEATGSAYNGMKPLKQYMTKKNNQEQVAKKITGGEYLDAVKAALKQFRAIPAFRPVRNNAMLVHDKGLHHVSVAVKEGLQSMGVSAVVQPARSPDLMPLDYGIFGTARLELGRRGLGKSAWEARVTAFKEILKGSKVAAVIDQFPRRVRACIEMNGEKFEDKMRALNRS
jgi:hypothetical protein